MARDPFEDLEVLETELVDPFEDLEKLRGRRQATIDAPDPAEEQFLRPAWEAKQRLAGFGRFVEEQTGKVKEDIGGLFGRRVGDFIDVEGKMERVVRRDPDAGTIETESGVYPAIIPMTEEQREYHGASELSQIGRSVGAALFGYPIDIMAFIGGHVPRALGEPEALVPEGVREPRTALLKEDIKGFEQLAKTLPLRAQYELYKAAGVEDPSQYTHALNPGVAAANAIEAVFGFLTGQVPDMKQSQEDIRRIVAQSQEEEQISAFGTHILAGGVRPLTTKRVRPGEPTTAAVRAQMRVDPSQSAPVQAAMEKMIKQEEAFWEFRESMVETFGTRPLEKLAGREKVGFDALVEKAVAKKKPAKKKPAKKVAKKPAGTAGSFTALVESHITPNKTLSRGLDYYGTLLKDMPTLELTKVMRWAEKHEMPYIRKRLGGNIEAEIRLRTTAQLKLKKPPKKRAPKPVKPKPAAKQPWEMTRKEYSWHVPKGTMYHQTGKGIVSKIETEGFRLDRPVARIGDDVMPDAVFMKPQPTDISVGGKIGETAQLEVLPKKGLLTKEFADRVKLEEYLKQDKEYARLKRISEELDKKQAKEIESVPLDDPALESKIEAMIQVSNRAATKARKRGTDFLREQGIEAIKIRKDRGFLGRSTETLGVLDPKNVTIVSHRKIIQQALSEGKPVPAEVLKDYPELGKKASKLKAAGKIVGGAAVTYAVLDKERREEIAGLGIPATFFIGSKRATRAAVSSMKKVNISALKELYSQHSVPPKLRPGYKQAISEIRAIKSDVAKSLNITLRQTPEGRLIAPSGQGKILAKATEVEKRRRDLSLARQHGIATRLTKSGKDVPAVRKSGVFVHEDFATYDKFKDIRSGPLGGTKDPIRFAQEIEGSLSVQQQAKLPEQQGPMMRFVESPRRQYEMLRQDFHTEQSKVLHSILDPLTKKERKQVTDLLESVVSNRAAYIDVNTLAKIKRTARITTNTKVLKAAQELRRWYDTMRVRANEMRAEYGVKPIPRRKYYSPHEIQKIALWSQVFGRMKEPRHFLTTGELPDYIHPEGPVNPRALARLGGLEKILRENDAGVLAEHYMQAISKDMFHRPIVQIYKAHANQLYDMGYHSSADVLRDYASEVYTGVRGKIDRVTIDKFPNWVKRAARHWRRSLPRIALALNFKWNLFVQTSSANLTYARYDTISSIRGLRWFTDPQMRKDIAKYVHSFRVKAEKRGQLTQQDVAHGQELTISFAESKLDTAVDAASMLTRVIERHLTGWSVATAYAYGKARGLRGRALWDYASDGGAKTQSMYNYSGIPGALRNEAIKTVAPFQTFSFELYNTMKEIAREGGVSPAAFRRKAGFVIRLFGGAMAVNYVAGSLSGREPWELKSFFPFAQFWLEPIQAELLGRQYTGRTRQLAAPAGAAAELVGAVRTYMVQDNPKKLRSWLIRYGLGLAGVPGTGQIARTADGIMAVAEGAELDALGAEKFPIDGTAEQVRAILGGPYSTAAGREYLNARQKGYLDLFASKTAEQEQRTVKSKARNLLKRGKFEEAEELINDWNSIFAGTDLALLSADQLRIQIEKAELAAERKAIKEGQ